MLGEPALVAGHHRGDAQGVALLAQQGVAAVAGAVGPDLAVFREVDDVLDRRCRARRRPARPAPAALPTVCTAGTKKPSSPSCVERGLAHAGHDPHRDHDVGAVGDLDAERADLRAERAHAEGHDVHRAAAHAAVEQARSGRRASRSGSSQLLVGPASSGSFGADEGAALDAGDVLGIGGGVEGVGALLGIEPFQRARRRPSRRSARSHSSSEPSHQMHAVGLGERGDLARPRRSVGVAGRARSKAPRWSWSSSQTLPIAPVFLAPSPHAGALESKMHNRCLGCKDGG